MFGDEEEDDDLEDDDLEDDEVMCCSGGDSTRKE